MVDDRIQIPSNLITYDNELYHFGTPRHSGRYPWGSGQRPYQGDNTGGSAYKQAKKGKTRQYYSNAHTIPKGTQFYRVTISPNESLSGQKYVTYLEEDRNLYSGGWIRMNRGSKEAYEHEMVLKEDLKVPGKKEVEEVIQQKVMTNQKLVKESITSWIDELIPPGTIQDYETFETDKDRQKFINDTIKNYPDWDLDTALKNHFQSFGMATEARTAVIDELKKRGYNAMVDQAGVGTNIKEGIDPLIVFDAEQSLSYKGGSKISLSKEISDRSKYQKWVINARKKSGSW